METLRSEGYQVIRNVLSADEVAQFRAGISATMDRIAGAMRTPFDASCPDAPIEERIDRAAARDRVYSVALFRGVLAMPSAIRESKLSRIIPD